MIKLILFVATLIVIEISILSYRNRKSSFPKRLSGHFKLNLPEMDIKDVKLIVAEYEKYKQRVRGSYCDICGKGLTHGERRFMDHTMCNYTCDEHHGYAHTYNVHKVRDDNKIKFHFSDYEME